MIKMDCNLTKKEFKKKIEIFTEFYVYVTYFT